MPRISVHRVVHHVEARLRTCPRRNQFTDDMLRRELTAWTADISVAAPSTRSISITTWACMRGVEETKAQVGYGTACSNEALAGWRD